MSALRQALPKAVRELRLFGCQQSPASEGVRCALAPCGPPLQTAVADQGNPPLTTRSAFIKSSYPAVKKANPDLPILIREANGTPARGFVRFGASPCFPPRALCSYLRSRGSARGEEGALAPFGWREGTWWPSGLAASVGRSMP